MSLSQRLANYGLAEHELQQRFLEQEKSCGLCFAPLSYPNFHVDHDHACCPDKGRSCGKCIRGLLCPGCNLLLGHAGESIERLESAIRYLKKWKAA